MPLSSAELLESPRAWRAVAAAFLVGFVVFGILYSFGAMLEPMAATFGTSRSAASVLFSITGLIFYFAGPFAGRLGDLMGPRPMIAAGAVILAAGMSVSAMLDRMWLCYLTYGAGAGMGLACAYTPSLAVVGGWFVAKRNMALGIAAAGTGVGTLVLPPLTAALTAAEGWRVACAATGGGSGVLLLIAAALVHPPPVPVTTARGIGRVVRHRAFLLLYASWLFATTALFVPMVFLPGFARAQGVAPVAASSLVSIIGAIGIGGRVGMGALGQRIGVVRLFRMSVAMMAASYVLWLIAGTYPGMVLFAVVLGIGYGLRIALMPAVLIEYFGLSNLGAVLGTFFTASGVSALLGPIAAAAIVDATGGGFTGGILFALAMGALGFLVLLPLPRI